MCRRSKVPRVIAMDTLMVAGGIVSAPDTHMAWHAESFAQACSAIVGQLFMSCIAEGLYVAAGKAERSFAATADRLSIIARIMAVATARQECRADHCIGAVSPGTGGKGKPPCADVKSRRFRTLYIALMRWGR